LTSNKKTSLMKTNLLRKLFGIRTILDSFLISTITNNIKLYFKRLSIDPIIVLQDYLKLKNQND
jgi:hypothetical protein